ncbi:MAG TPA: hypothetical protein VNI57_11730, partial [Candidatus Saccharimonadales bacterium]|nr:hypothetical protein [Candidatus Saccharimonadales bacterium]
MFIVVLSAAPSRTAAEDRLPPRARQVTWQERLGAERAILRVYQVHQAGPGDPSAAAIPEAVVERRVRTYLKQSEALDVLWSTPITTGSLDREWRRMLEGSRMPGRLEELVHALGDDPVLVRECLVRPVLVNRMARSFLASDRRYQSSAQAEAENLRDEIASGGLDPSAPHP